MIANLRTSAKSKVGLSSAIAAVVPNGEGATLDWARPEPDRVSD